MLMYWSHIPPPRCTVASAKMNNQRDLDRHHHKNIKQLNLKSSDRPLSHLFYHNLHLSKGFRFIWVFFVFILQKEPQDIDLFQHTENVKDAQEYGKNIKFVWFEDFYVRWIVSLIGLSDPFVFCYLQISFTSSILIMFLKIWKI